LGYHLSALFALWVTALLFLVVDWGVVLTVSFQFPFVTVAFLIGVSHSRIFEVHGWSKWLADNLVVTTFVSMETFPILLNIFGRVSLEVFWLNLIPRSHNGDLFYLSAQ
jgi:predicted membrane metal-binding protein